MISKRFLTTLLCLSGWSSSALAQTPDYSIDQTCIACSRRTNDSINVFHRRKIRVNQVGYLPEESKKFAMVASLDTSGFHVIDEKGQVAFSGGLTKLDVYAVPRRSAEGYSNSITQEYAFVDSLDAYETLYTADFGGLHTPGRFRLVHGSDTSAAFWIEPDVYNKVLEKVLFFFGANRCGNTQSWLHAACHLLDGSALGPAYAGRLAGGWHDCGDHVKNAPTISYATMVLSLAYAIWPERAPDLYGSSYAVKTPDGIPDILGEAKVGVDYIYNLYSVSKDRGLLDTADMFHSVGDLGDHSFWDVPEKQDAAPKNLGGPDRSVVQDIGSDLSGSFAASLALFSHAWKSHDSAYASKLLVAAADIYDHIVMKKLGKSSAVLPVSAPQSITYDDEAMAALALWFATGDSKYKYDLLDDPKIGYNPNANLNGVFPAGHLGHGAFNPGGWTTDYANIQVFVVYGLAKLILPNPVIASSYGISNTTRDSLLAISKACLARAINVGSNGANSASFPGMHVSEPYHLLFNGMSWGFNSYNLGMVDELFMYYDLTQQNTYRQIGIDNLNYLLGVNPYDISFINGCGDRNLQHPHHRASNPEGYNQGGTPYPYRPLTGAVMGGVAPGNALNDNWVVYTNTESCLDFAAQAIFPLMVLSQSAPPSDENHAACSRGRYPRADASCVEISPG